MPGSSAGETGVRGLELPGRTALVTGASRGIGRATALRLAEAGANVVVNYVSQEQAAREVAAEVEARGRGAVAVQANVADREDVGRLFSAATDAFGRVDILVNNAGILRDNLIVRMSDEQWDEVVNTNLRGAFLCARQAVRSMMQQRWGRIINVSSAIAVKGNIGQSNYAASKAALLGFTAALAREVATRSITVNAVLPGYVETEIVQDLSASVRETILSHIPLGRFGRPEEICGMVAFLCSDEAQYITGQAFPVDGGITL